MDNTTEIFFPKGNERERAEQDDDEHVNGQIDYSVATIPGFLVNESQKGREIASSIKVA